MTVIAIDGPAGAGKSTVARAVARALGFCYLDTGALYRAVALAALERDIDLSDAERLVKLAAALEIELDGETVRVEGRDVSARIRAPDVTAAASTIAALVDLRRALADRQRRIAASEDVVMEGRDIGTIIAPEAEVKIFLTASLEERALRRARQLGLPTEEASLARLARTLAERDHADAERAASPLAAAEDAVVIDTTGKVVERVVEEIITAVKGVLADR